MIYSAIILAAGRSKRMDFQKAFLKDKNNYSFISKHINNYINIGCNEIIVVLNSKVLNYGLKTEPDVFNKVIIITNNYPERGRFYSIKLGINSLTVADACFLQNVDNPAIKTNDLMKMIKCCKSDNWIAPEFDNKTGHPVLISKPIIEKIMKTKHNNLILKDFLNTFKKVNVAVNSKNIHLNINTIDDYLCFLKNE